MEQPFGLPTEGLVPIYKESLLLNPAVTIGIGQPVKPRGGLLKTNWGYAALQAGHLPIVLLHSIVACYQGCACGLWAGRMLAQA